MRNPFILIVLDNKIEIIFWFISDFVEVFVETIRIIDKSTQQLLPKNAY